ncbi:MAG: peptide deformylase [bacterium]
MIHTIRKYGDPILKKKTEAVTKFDNELKQTFSDMLETMYAFNGLGLAANQIGISKSMLVLDASTEEQTILYALANPQVIQHSKEKVEFEEGCLSFPGINDKISRPAIVKIKAQDSDGNELIIEASGLLAIVLQHEIDHLNGIIFIDRMTSIRKMLHAKELKELKKLQKKVSK